ncbi:MAG: NAD(+)/NADH kinase, partial [Clostridia bacterium]|nr:NAD(+)/NADH kinase [Clostridia bacterium]
AEEYIKMKSLPLEQVAKLSDILIVFGGDGTMLSVARKVVKEDISLLGVNTGKLGFLTECEEHEDLEKIAEKLISGDFRLETRAMLNVSYGINEYLALNEVSLSRGISKHTIDVSIYVDGGLCDKVTGDGVIISTPTGSTAYAMSCGGAILSPSVKAFGVTAICPHSLNSRPMVVGDESELCLVANDCKNKDVVVCVDGENIILSENKIEVFVKKSEYYTKLIRLNENNFYNKLIQKMSGWNKL